MRTGKLHGALVLSRVTRRVPIALVGVWLVASTQISHAQQSYDGVYEASPARVTANVETWGKDCGVRPKSYTLKERPTVPVEVRGAHLHMQFPSGTLRTDRCWSQNPALHLESKSATKGKWRARCKTPAGDPKSETGVYEIVARDANTLELIESSRYDWQLKESHCVAAVRIVRTLAREPEPGAKPAPAPKPTTTTVPDKPEPPPPEESCVPGAMEKLSIVPSRMRAEPGQRVCFTARAFDANGCRIPKPQVSWSVKSKGHGRGAMYGNCFKAADSAAEGEGTFRLTAQAGRFKAAALVRVQTPDLSDITAHNVLAEARPFDAGIEDVEPVATQTETRVAARRVRSDDGMLRWAVLAAALALLAAVGAGFVLRRKGQEAAAEGPAGEVFASPADSMPDASYERAEPESPPALADEPSPPPQPAATEPMICPTCRRGYAPGTTQCETDGTPLMTYKAFTQQVDTSQPQLRCKECGTEFRSDTIFCGKCGARLQ